MSGGISGRSSEEGAAMDVGTGQRCCRLLCNAQGIPRQWVSRATTALAQKNSCQKHARDKCRWVGAQVMAETPPTMANQLYLQPEPT